jgi:hypothetical protein
VYVREGEWNDASEAFAGVTLICSACFADLRATQHVPRATKRTSWLARLFGR